MIAEREQPHAAQHSAVPHTGVPEELEELLFTLQICRRALQCKSHTEHEQKKKLIEALVRTSFERE